MDNQYYYKLMASYLSKRNCDESFMRYVFGKNSLKKTPEELERADERKRRLQRERSRRYRALKNARRQHEGVGGKESGDSETSRFKSRNLVLEEDFSDSDEPPTLCDLNYNDKWREPGTSSDCPSDENSTHSAAELKDATLSGNVSLSLREFLSSPNAELDYPTVHSLMFHWLQT